MPRLLPLVGRDRELAQLRTLMADAAAGDGGLVLLSGEAGSGKTALLAAALTAAAPLLPVVGRCPGPEETPPLGPWREVAAELLARCGGGPIALPPPLGTDPTDGSPPALARALARWLGACGPVLVALEDLQWADAASLDLLRHLAPRLARRPVLLIATYRSDEAQAAHPLWDVLPELLRAGAVPLPLARLAEADVAQLVAAALPGAPGLPGLARTLHQRTGGHPLFVTALLAASDSTGSVLQADAPLPDSVEQVIDRRLARLTPAALQCLEQAAVLGERFAYDALLHLAEAPPAAVDAALAEAAAHRLLRSEAAGERWVFDHALVRQALLDRTPPRQRRQWHQRAAEALLAQPGADLDAAALHLVRAGEVDRASECLALAGDSALRRGALSQAAERYARALALLPPDGPGRAPDRRRGELELKRALACADGRPAEGWACAMRAQALARACGDAAVHVWSRYLQAVWSWGSGERGALRCLAGVLAEQERLLGDERYHRLERELFGSALAYPRVAGLLVLAYQRAGWRRKAAALLQRVRGAAAPPEQALRLELGLAGDAGRWREALALGGAAADAAAAGGDLRGAVSIEGNRLYHALLCQADDPEAVDAVAACLQERLAALAAAGGRDLAAEGYPPLGWYHFLRGDWQQAEHHLLGYLNRHPQDSDPGVRGFAALLLMARGDLAGARALLAVVPPHRPEEPAGLHRMQIAAYCHKGELALRAGDLATGRAWLAAAERFLRAQQRQPFRAALHLAWARYHRQAGDLAAARAESEQGLELAIDRGEFRFIIMAHQLLGEVLAAQGQRAAGRRHLQAAIDLAERCRFPYYAALARLARATALPAAPEAAADLSAARQAFAQLGAAAPLRQCEAALAARRGAPTPADALTPREVQVLRLVAEGLPDKAVAAELGISRHTVDNHLRRIFAKLGVGSRTALATFAARHGLI